MAGAVAKHNCTSACKVPWLPSSRCPRETEDAQ